MQRGTKIWKPAGRQKNDKKEQLFVKGNLRRHEAQALSPGSCGARVGVSPRSGTLGAGRLECWAPLQGGSPLPYAQTTHAPFLFLGEDPCLFLLLSCSHPMGLGAPFLFPSFHTEVSFNLPRCTPPPPIPGSNFSNFSSELPLACSEQMAPVWT